METKQEVSGRELDAAVAERVMGWERVHEESTWNGYATHKQLLGSSPAGRKYGCYDPVYGVPHFSRDWYAAGLVIEEMRRDKGADRWYRFLDYLGMESGDGFLGTFMEVISPELIARAALYAVEAR
jgi:hypothetical protein